MVSKRRASWRLLMMSVTLAGVWTACADDITPAQTEAFSVAPSVCDPEEGLRIFAQRIAPLTDASNPSSCQKCHLAGTRLSEFVRGTPCEAIACMEEQGLVNLEEPESSQVLEFIRRGMPTDDEHNSAAAQEYVAFLTWIEHSAQCQTEICGNLVDPCRTGADERDVICASDDHEACGTEPRQGPVGQDQYACDERGMALAFHDLVMPWRNRCAHCHTPSGSLSDVGDPPHWMDDRTDEDGSLRTMRNILRTGLVDIERIGRSPILTKPLRESRGGLPHGGGDKFIGPSDDSYGDFLAWLFLYSRCAPVPEDPTLAAP